MCCLFMKPMGRSSKHTPLDEETLKYCIDNSHFKKKEIKHIYHKFMKESPEGMLTKGQFINLYKMKGARDNADIIASHLFRAFDLDNSYYVDFPEFVTCLSITTRGTAKEQVKWIFRLYDINGDGVLQINEVLEILKSANLEDEDAPKIVELFEKMDVNKDGVLSREEFINQSMSDDTFVRLLGRRKGSSGVL